MELLDKQAFARGQDEKKAIDASNLKRKKGIHGEKRKFEEDLKKKLGVSHCDFVNCKTLLKVPVLCGLSGKFVSLPIKMKIFFLQYIFCWKSTLTGIKEINVLRMISKYAVQKRIEYSSYEDLHRCLISQRRGFETCCTCGSIHPERPLVERLQTKLVCNTSTRVRITSKDLLSILTKDILVEQRIGIWVGWYTIKKRMVEDDIMGVITQKLISLEGVYGKMMETCRSLIKTIAWRKITEGSWVDIFGESIPYPPREYWKLTLPRDLSKK